MSRVLRVVPVLVGLCVLVSVNALVPSAEPPAGKKYALLVGVNEYDHAKLPALKYAENDAADMANALSNAGYEVIVLTGAAGRKDATKAPTHDNIHNALNTVVKKYKKGDTILIAFAGHGLQFAGDKECYFCPQDAKPFKDKTQTLVALSAVYKELDEAFDGTKILLVDACRNDPDPARGRGIDSDNAPSPPKGVAALFSCSAGQRAYESDTLKHGIFFHFVLEALQGKAGANDRDEVTWSRLTEYVPDKVETEVRKQLGGDIRQSPNAKADVSGRSPVLVALDKEAPAPLGMKFIRLPKGTFYMGGGGGKAGKKTEIAEDFEIAVFTVTQGQWQDLMGDNPSWFRRGGDNAKAVENIADGDLKQFPVENVSWDMVQDFLKELNKREKGSGFLYRLPKEAEWEYACRGGATSEEECSYHFYFHKPTNELTSKMANFDGNYPYPNTAAKGDYLARPTKVGSYKPNKLGLYDMHGNVWQWCDDLDGASGRVIRGGGWDGDGVRRRAARRISDAPSDRDSSIGFRLARVPSR